MPKDPPPPWVVDLRRHIGNRMRDLRATRGMSQETLAERCGVDRRTIGRWENGYSVPDLDNLIRLTTALGIPLRRLFE